MRTQKAGTEAEWRAVLILRVAAGLMGLIGGALFGLLILIAAILLTGSNLGLANVLPGAYVGAAVGFFAGVYRPQVGLSLIRALSK